MATKSVFLYFPFQNNQPLKWIMRKMKKYALVLLCLMTAVYTNAQTADEQLNKANTLYRQLKETDALDAYKSVLTVDNRNMTALVKCTELSSSLGSKQVDKTLQSNYYLASKDYADKALAADTNNADAWYCQALAFSNLAGIETENKKAAEDAKFIKLSADKGLAINPNHARLNYTEGRWHFEMLELSFVKKAALKTIYSNGMPKPDIDSAIYYMEKCRVLEPYFVQNYLDLAKAYDMKKRPAQTIEVLQKLVKLPNRMADDAALKEEGKKMLQKME